MIRLGPLSFSPVALGCRLRTAALSGLLVLLATVGPALGQGVVTQAREALLIDMTSGTVLLDVNSDQRMPTSSMSKIMTMYMLFEAIEQGRLSMEDTLPVSEYAWRKGGSKMFVEVGTRVRVEDLVRGIIVQSGNDASIVVAEALAGSEEEFGRRMTERAHELGLLNSNFTNATGWPDPNHYSTAADLALLAQHLINDFPQYYSYYSEREFTYNNIRQDNRNPLLGRVPGADGLKTGHTSEAGYGLTASAERNGRRLVLVINGLPSMAARGEEAERLIEWGFREFETLSMFDAMTAVETVDVWMGSPSRVDLVSPEPIAMTLRRQAIDDMQVAVRVEQPLEAPIAAGEVIAHLVVTVPDMPERLIPLHAARDIDRQGFFGRAFTLAGHLLFGWMQ